MAIEWTPERLQILKNLRERGMSYSKIAVIMGCSTNAAVSAWHRKVQTEYRTFSRLLKAEREQKIAEMNTWMAERAKANVPTLAFISGLGTNPRYRMKEVSVV